MAQKTIFITISRGGTARNILQTKVFEKLKSSGNRIVILTPAWQDERFVNEFKADNVFFENLLEPKWTVLDTFLVGWHKALPYNQSTKLRDLYGIYDPKDGSVLKYLVKSAVFIPFSKLQFLKEFFRYLDAKLVKSDIYKEIFENYKPDLVFSTSIMEDADVMVLKQAKALKIKTIGMTKSWDNTAKMCFRVKTDKLIVWGDYSKEESKRFQNYKKSDIVVCGVPQFDFYKNDEYLQSREDFCRTAEIDASKKIIVFCSEGKVSKNDGDIAKILLGFIDGKELNKDAVLYIRPHFMYLGDEYKFASMAKKENAFLDSGYNRSMIFRDKWDYSKEQIKKFTNVMRHADIVITSASTISLDAAAFDRPVINIAFDGYKELPFEESIARWYKSEHNSNVVKIGAVWLVDNQQELLNALNSYLENPNLLSAGRGRLRNYFCYKIDGLSGERIADEILDYVNK